MNNPLISIIIACKNNSEYIEKCLESVKNQTYQNIEIIVVDNNSTDNTKEIAKRFTEKVFNKGPERSAQRNYGVDNSQGEFVLIIDSDMVLSEKIIESCIDIIKNNNKIVGLIIPEESFGEGFWAQCKKLERSFYVGVDWIEAARFFRKDVYQKVGGFNEKMISAEDWDLSQRIEVEGKISRTNDYIYHNEGNLSLLDTLKKKLYYAKQLKFYTENENNYEKIKKQTGILERYKLFFSQPKKLFQNPILGIGMLFMKTCEFVFGGVGYLISKIKK